MIIRNSKSVYNAGLQVCLLVGVISVGKGLYELGFGHGSSHDKGQVGQFAKAIAHIFAGACLINLPTIITVVFNTLGIGGVS